EPPVSGMNQHPVRLEKFVQLRAEMKRADVIKLLGKIGEHLFTYQDADRHVWQCEEYAVAQESRYASSGYDLLYKNDGLYALVDCEDRWPHYKALIGLGPEEIEDSEKQKERLRRTPVRKFDDDTDIREFFRVKSVRGDDIAKLMPDLK